MPRKELVDYLQKNLALGHNEDHIKQHVIAHGWPEDEVEEALQIIKSPVGKEKKKFPLGLVLIFLGILSIVLLVYSVMSTPPVEKPVVEKPVLQAISGQAIASQHVEYMFNELGAYELEDS